MTTPEQDAPNAYEAGPVHGPRPLGGLADLAELLGGETAGSRRFVTGLIAGAIVGAMVAGGQLIRQRRKGRGKG
jgi:hypothetical protein